MENELNFDRHYYLYAKNHYKASDFITDLKIITGIRCGMDSKDENLNDVASILLSIVYPYAQKFSEYAFKEFIADINPAKMWMWDNLKRKDYYSGVDFMESVCHKCISILALTKVADIPFELGEADSKVLPLREKS
jgi:hypothetical protein